MNYYSSGRSIITESKIFHSNTRNNNCNNNNNAATESNTYNGSHFSKPTRGPKVSRPIPPIMCPSIGVRHRTSLGEVIKDIILSLRVAHKLIIFHEERRYVKWINDIKMVAGSSL